MPETVEIRPNQVYYREVGSGAWRGWFDFEVTDRAELRRDPIGLRNRLLVELMAFVAKLPGRSRIVWVAHELEEGGRNVVENVVRVSRFGLTLYLLRESCDLFPDGRQVWVRAVERFGPIPRLFVVLKEHPAEVIEEGMSTISYVPLLGTAWEGRSRVRSDRRHIESIFECAWGRARDVVDRVG